MMKLTWTHTAVVVSVVASLALAVAIGAIPPKASAADAARAAFSANRAMEDVRGVTASGKPHPVGSADHDRVRDYLLGRLRELGLEPETQQGIVQSSDSHFGRAAVTNIVARLEGTEPGPGILLVAHYDSTAHGPGAADDGAGVASILEIVRAMKERGPPRHPIVVLLDDGEEVGLLGAELFVTQHEWTHDVRVVLNFEARGNQGQTAMFETSEGNGWLVNAYARSVDRPFANSAIYTLYKLLPNNTDLTVFKVDGGMQGLNFAFADRAWHYHTPNDTADQLDPRSLQHMGDQGLALTNALANGPLQERTVDAVYFDLFTLGMIKYPVSWAAIVAWIGALIAVIAMLVAVMRASVSGRSIAVSLACLILVLVGSMVASAAVTSLIGALSGSSRPWASNPVPTWLAQVGASIAASAWPITWLRAREELVPPRRLGASPVALWCAAAVLWTLLSLLVAHMLPGASHLFTHPALAMSTGLLLVVVATEGRSERRFLWAALAGLVVAGFHWLTLLRILRTMVGADAPPVTAFAVSLVVTAAAPLIGAMPVRARRWLWAGAGLLAMAAVLTAVVST